MIKNTLITFFMLILLSTNSYSAGTSSGTGTNSANNYSKAVKLVKAAKKYENDGKVEKANKTEPGIVQKTSFLHIFRLFGERTN